MKSGGLTTVSMGTVVRACEMGMGLSLTQHLKAKLHNKAQPLTCFYLPFSSVGSAMLACVSCGQSNKLRGGGWGKRENVCVECSLRREYLSSSQQIPGKYFR